MTGARPETSPDNSRLWYTDPVGQEVVRRLMPGDYAITDSSGFTIIVDAEALKPALMLYNFHLSRTGRTLRARLKRVRAEAG